MANWNRRYIRLSKFVSRWSKDTSKVGSVIAIERRGAIALGYNGFPGGVEDDMEVLTKKEKKDLKRNMVVHAEENALLIAGHAAQGATLFVWGKPICARCAVSIIQAGIKKVVATDPNDEEDKASIWHELGVLAIKLLREAKIEIIFYKVENRINGTDKIVLPDDPPPPLPLFDGNPP